MVLCQEDLPLLINFCIFVTCLLNMTLRDTLNFSTTCLNPPKFTPLSSITIINWLMCSIFFPPYSLNIYSPSFFNKLHLECKYCSRSLSFVSSVTIVNCTHVSTKKETSENCIRLCIIVSCSVSSVVYIPHLCKLCVLQ